jgi:hypothetical protein
MSAQELAAQTLAELQAKADEHLAALRERAADAKEKLKLGLLNVQSKATASELISEAPPPADLNWDLETEAAAESTPASEASLEEDFRTIAPEPPPSFSDELDVATDELGIPLGD